MNKKLKYIIAVFLAWSLSSCKDSFFDVNTDPNQPAAVPPSTLLTTLEYDAAFANGNEIDRITSLWMQHIAGTANQATGYDVYNIAGSSYDNQWNFELYAGLLTNAQQLISQNQQTSPVYAGMGKILKAYGFSMVTDLWGDVPYSEALQGATNTTPKFDTQQDIYQGTGTVQSLFDLVREGMADLDKSSAVKPSSDDVVYGGDVTKWKRFGNTLMLRMAMTISRKNPDLAKKVIAEVLASSAGLISDNTQDFEVKFGSDNGKQNPIYSFNYVNRTTDQMMSIRMRDTLQTALNNDPRISKFYTPVVVNGQNTYVAYDNGSTAAAPTAVANRSRYGSYLVGTFTNTALTTATGDAPIRLMTNFQRAFLLAEASLTLGITVTGKTANDLYQEGIKASMTKAGVATADINTYFTGNSKIVTLAGSSANQLNQVMTQKWVANIGNGYEAWNDWRRTGYPKLAKALNAAGEDGTIPVRFPYTTNEIQRNPNAPNPGPKANVRVWWDVD